MYDRCSTGTAPTGYLRSSMTFVVFCRASFSIWACSWATTSAPDGTGAGLSTAFAIAVAACRAPRDTSGGSWPDRTHSSLRNSRAAGHSSWSVLKSHKIGERRPARARHV